MPWDNSLNKNAVIYAVVATVLVEHMPSTTWVRALGSISLSRQTGIYRVVFRDLTNSYIDETITVTAIITVQIIHKLLVLEPPGSVPSD